MHIFDCHSDIWTDVYTRTLKGEKNIIRKYHFNKLKEGKIAGSIFVIWLDSSRLEDPYKTTMEIMDSINMELNYCQDLIFIAKSYEDIEKALKEKKIYVFMGLEGLSSIGENLSLIDYFYELGFRHVSLTWNEENALATGVRGNPVRGLTPVGKEAVKKINDNKMLLDVSHLNEKSFWDLVNITDKPFIASHSNCKSICNVPRNLSDEQLRIIADIKGVVGINSFNQFIHKDVEKQNLNTLVQHVVHMVEVMGIDHVGIGMDYCDFIDDEVMSGFRLQETSYTKGLEDASKTYNFIREMERVGFHKDEIEKVAYKNFHRIIKEILSS
ncbi:MAG TPA: membrane dipeptidase [Tissierellia bacterium]|nr:membrane dipeptidase [Tissierellia bacterium]